MFVNKLILYASRDLNKLKDGYKDALAHSIESTNIRTLGIFNNESATRTSTLSKYNDILEVLTLQYFLDVNPMIRYHWKFLDIMNSFNQTCRRPKIMSLINNTVHTNDFDDYLQNNRLPPIKFFIHTEDNY